MTYPRASSIGRLPHHQTTQDVPPPPSRRRMATGGHDHHLMAEAWVRSPSEPQVLLVGVSRIYASSLKWRPVATFSRDERCVRASGTSIATRRCQSARSRSSLTPVCVGAREKVDIVQDLDMGAPSLTDASQASGYST